MLQRQASVSFPRVQEEAEPPARRQYLEREFPLLVGGLEIPAIRRILFEEEAPPVEVYPGSPEYASNVPAASAAFESRPNRLAAVSDDGPATQEWSDESDDDDEYDTVFFPQDMPDNVYVQCRSCPQSQTIVFEPVVGHRGWYVAVLRPCVCASV